MPADANLKINVEPLNRLNSNLKEKYITKVGILGDKNARQGNDGASNSLIGAVQEFGSIVRNILARSWLRAPLMEKSKEFSQDVATSININLTKPGGIKKIFMQAGLIAEVVIAKAFESSGFGKWSPLSQKTIKRKGSDKQLMDTGQLRRSVTSQVERVK